MSVSPESTTFVNINSRPELFRKFDLLRPDQKPVFGLMTPHHMVEHLTECVRYSNGNKPMQLALPEEKSKEIFSYLILTDNEIPLGFKSPVLGDNLVDLRTKNIAEAVEVLRKELDLFDHYFKSNPESKPVSPILGALSYAEWVIFHNKHFTHHFNQFNLL